VVFRLNDMQEHKYITNIQLAREYLGTLSKEYYEAFHGSQKPPIEGINSFLLNKLTISRLPLTWNDKISLIIQSICEGTYDLRIYPKKQYTFCFAYKHLLDSSSNKVFQLYNGVVDVLYVITGRVPSVKSMNNFLNRYFIYSLLDILEDRYKFHTGHLVCSLIPPTELPKTVLGEEDEHELPGVVIGGWVRRFFLSKHVSYKLKLKLAMSLQNAKRAAASISEIKQIHAKLDHQKSMSGNDYDRSSDPTILNKVCQKVSQLVKIYYPKEIMAQIPIWRLPSQSACSQTSSVDGGTMGYFFENHYDYDVRCHMGDVQAEGEFGKIPIFSFGFNLAEMKAKIWDEVNSTYIIDSLYHRVLEPFKVRGITAGDPNIYQLGRLLQPVLHSHLRDPNGPFRFIGKRHNINDISSVYTGTYLWKEEERLAQRGESLFTTAKTFFVAGDYKSATDNMHPLLPRTFINAFCKHTDITWQWASVLEMTLCNHRILYPDLPMNMKKVKNEEGLEEKIFTERFPQFRDIYKSEVIQEWGQLMGSPTSFPVLCLVNAAMLWASVELFEKKVLSWNYILDQYKPLFNGDDISFASNIDHYRLWKHVCTCSGLALSAGKNYISPHFVNINSTNYGTILEEGERGFLVKGFEDVYVVNPGLLKGQAKVLDDTRKPKKDSPESLMPVIDQLNECLMGSSDEERERTLEVFRHHLEPRLLKSRRSWILPRHLGGLGLPFGSQPTEGQLAVAEALMKRYRDVSDLKGKATFQEMSSEYWTQIEPDLLKLTGAEIIKPHIAYELDLQPSRELFELPTLTASFISYGHNSKDLSLYDLIEKTDKNGQKKTYFKAKDPEEKFISLRKNCRFRSKLSRKLFLETCLKTRLVKGGCTKKLIVSVAEV